MFKAARTVSNSNDHLGKSSPPSLLRFKFLNVELICISFFLADWVKETVEIGKVGTFIHDAGDLSSSKSVLITLSLARFQTFIPFMRRNDRTAHSGQSSNVSRGNDRDVIGNNGDGAPSMEPTMKCMTVVEEGTQISFACYDEKKNEILLEQSRSHGHDTESIVEGFVAAMRPNLILVSAKIATNAPLMELLTTKHIVDSDTNGNVVNDSAPAVSVAAGSRESDAHNSDGPTRTEGRTIPYQLLKSKAFDIRNCKNLILNKLRVMTLFRRPPRGTAASSLNHNHHQKPPHHNASSAAPSRYHSLASIIDFSSPILLKSLGSLLHFLQNTIFRLEEGSTITINNIQYVTSSQYMRIDPTTIHSLHIFSTEYHPLRGVRGKGKEKEGFSLFTLLDRTKSKVGRQCLREWMLKPLLDPRKIRQRQSGVGLFLNVDCRECAERIMIFLARVGAVDKILLRMQKCHSAAVDFIVLEKTLAAAVSVVNLLNGELRGKLIQEYSSEQHQLQDLDGGVSSPLNRIREKIRFVDDILQRCHVPVLQDLHERIVSIVDQEATAETKESVVIHYGFHEELDNAKEAFDNLDGTLSAVGSEVLQKYPTLGTLKVVFLPQVGFLIAIDKRNHSNNVATNEFPDLPHDFAYVFIQGDEAFFKNIDMRRLDEEIGDLDAFIKDTEGMIVSELEEDVLDCESELRSTFGALAELDCILAFASCAADLNFVQPDIIVPGQTNGNVGSQGEQGIFIENGRHPLQELIIDSDFIANDTNIDEARRINVVTGPNFSGKSCYTRQVGMLVYMAHIGSFVPADCARISITDQILARISSVETCAVPQSSFQVDLTQMATILRRSTPRTLVLIDEFGKGTSPVSGIAVLTAALKKLVTLRCSVICTTHFLEIFSLGLLADGQDSVKVLQLAVHIPDQDEDDAVPLFKLEEGLAKSSAGLACAKMAGVHEDVTSRAKEILGALKSGDQVKPIPANANSNSVFQPSAKVALRYFLGVDSWNDASEGELDILQQKIALM